jgi:hypothetical protein
MSNNYDKLEWKFQITGIGKQLAMKNEDTEKYPIYI